MIVQRFLPPTCWNRYNITEPDFSILVLCTCSFFLKQTEKRGNDGLDVETHKCLLLLTFEKTNAFCIYFVQRAFFRFLIWASAVPAHKSESDIRSSGDEIAF